MAEQNARIGHVDALRGLAALYVVVGHMYMAVYGASGAFFGKSVTATLFAPFLYGRGGVDLFLVISGFVLFHPVVTGKRPVEGYGRFLARRAWRIVPPYWAAIALTLATLALVPRLQGLLPYTEWPSWQAVATHLLMIHNLTGGRDLYTVIPQAWTIPLEYQLYMTFPLLALAFARFGGVKAVAGAIAFTVLARWGLAQGAVRLGMENVWVNSFPGYLSLFATGMLAAALAHADAFAGRSRALLATSVAFCGLGLLAWHVWGFYFVGDTLWGIAAAALILAGRDGLAWLRTPALAWMGRFSYSTYLIHYLVLAAFVALLSPLGLLPWARFALLLALGLPTLLLAAYAFHLACERPFLTTPAWLRTPRPAPSPAAHEAA